MGPGGLAGDSQSLTEPAFVERVFASVGRKWQHLLDQSTIYVYGRWTTSLVLLILYMTRVLLLNAFHIITYGLGIYLLNLFIGFLSPQIDPETEGPVLPSTSSEEFRPFSRRVPEFKFWYATTRATFIAILMTFFEVFNVPVFWPILLMYFIILFTLTMKRQIKHMWKHNYVPWSSGKQVYKGKGGNDSK
ncbi:retention in endoplasmic reticulum protein 1 [Aphanomyces cochlioides]|nr:retention in endoplasmic reticulum protein 1 [Aphanomyces cochlioides]